MYLQDLWLYNSLCVHRNAYIFWKKGINSAPEVLISMIFSWCWKIKISNIPWKFKRNRTTKKRAIWVKKKRLEEKNRIKRITNRISTRYSVEQTEDLNEKRLNDVAISLRLLLVTGQKQVCQLIRDGQWCQGLMSFNTDFLVKFPELSFFPIF